MTEDDRSTTREVLCYLNFSNGTPDAGFQSRLNRLHAMCAEFLKVEHAAAPAEGSADAGLPPLAFPLLEAFLLRQLEELRGEGPAFENDEQARNVITTVFEGVVPGYRAYHADLLFHLTDADFEQPFLLARMFEAVLAEGAPWTERERLTRGAIDRLNDFIGFRPVAVLVNNRAHQPYPHERFRPTPLYIRDAGCAFGRYQQLIERTIQFLAETPEHIRHESYFELANLDELAVDIRSHDHNHPVNKRTNYMFGEWDPGSVDNKGHFRRFVIRRIILDALIDWIDSQTDVPLEESLFDAAAVLSGTMLMASAISGSGPGTHGGDVTLSSLLPRVARQRDAFYARLIQSATGARAKRLKQSMERTQQPFGHVRQHLNIQLAEYGARQVLHRHLGHMFARIGYSDAAKEEAAVIPTLSIRFACDMQWRITAAHLDLDRADAPQASQRLVEAEDLLNRGIECGAFVDPWNILAFQGQFPLFSSREDSVPDQRVELILDLMEQLFGAYSRTLGEAAAEGNRELQTFLSQRFLQLADRWDRYATVTIEDLPHVSGGESWDSAAQVADALERWRAAGEESGNISFWREHVQEFRSARAYALAVEALLQKKDFVAAMGLLMHWLSEADQVGFESGPHSLNALLMTWMAEVIDHSRKSNDLNGCWQLLKRLFDYLEANAESYWNVPTLASVLEEEQLAIDEVMSELDDEFDDDFDDDDDSEESQLFRAAYDDVVFRDSTRDGWEGETLEEGVGNDSELDAINLFLEPRLQFLNTVTNLWQMAAEEFVIDSNETIPADTQSRTAVIREWSAHARRMQRGLRDLLHGLWQLSIPAPEGDPDSNIEYDHALQMKFFLLHATVSTAVDCEAAERTLACCLSDESRTDPSPTDEGSPSDSLLTQVYRGIFHRDAETVADLLPEFLQQLSSKPLLYVPFDKGGHPEQVLDARSRQTVIRFLLSQLPGLGLIRHTWHVLKTAHQMEQNSRPTGMAVSEFDRLFRTALRHTLEYLGESARRWQRRSKANPDFNEQTFIEITGHIVGHYRDQWLNHSRTMRLSSVEVLNGDPQWERVREFIQRYGGDLFHAKLLTLGNVRAILHHGVDQFLEHLDESRDPLHPIRLLDDLDEGQIEFDEAVELLEIVYEIVVDRFDRFLEYNTTTTQSDYGERFYCLLDFLRTEAGYERDAWNLAPFTMTHEVLAKLNQSRAAEIWEQLFEQKCRNLAQRHLKRLHELERKYGMQLPSVSDRLNERFVKPLAVNRMLALIPRAITDLHEGRLPSKSFKTLREEIDDYCANTSGAGIDVPGWLRTLENEVYNVDEFGPDDLASPNHDLHLPLNSITLTEVRHQLDIWNEPLGG